MVSVYALLEEFPSARKVAAAHLTRLKALLETASKGRYKRDMALEIRDTARNSIGSWMPAKSLELQHTIRLIRELDNEIAEIEDRFKLLWRNSILPLLPSRGSGFRIAAMILAEVGDFSRFYSRTSCWLMPGCPPPLTSPGSSKTATRTWKSAVPGICAMPFTMQPNMSVTGIRLFTAYLAKKRAEGKHYNVAISHAAKKLVRLIFAMEGHRNLTFLLPELRFMSLGSFFCRILVNSGNRRDLQ